MARFVPEESSEIATDYVNLPDASAVRKNISRSWSTELGGLRLYRCVAVSFGLLCFLQAALNISLRQAQSRREDSCKSLRENCEELMRHLTNSSHLFQPGWVYVYPSLYYISPIKKSWQESRDDCLQRRADLIIINSKEEQDFARSFNRFTWIGLTNIENGRTWKWVDGTLLTKSYWTPGEPNRFEGRNENCVQLKLNHMENSWNDNPCDEHNFWICEKMSF